MTIAVPRDPKQTITIRCQGHARHPNAALASTGILIPNVGLWRQWAGLGGKVGYNLFRYNINSHDNASVIEQVAVAAKCTIDIVANLNQRRSLQDDTANKVLGRGVVADRAIDEDREARDIFQGIDVDAVEVVYAVVGSCIARSPISWDVCLGEEIHNIRGWVDDRGTSNTNSIRDVRTAYIGLQKWCVDLSFIDRIPSLGVEGSNVVL